MKLFRVEYTNRMMVYAEDIEHAKVIFTEKMEENEFCGSDEIMAMESNNIYADWKGCVPYGAPDGMDCESLVLTDREGE